MGALSLARAHLDRDGFRWLKRPWASREAQLPSEAGKLTCRGVELAEMSRGADSCGGQVRRLLPGEKVLDLGRMSLCPSPGTSRFRVTGAAPTDPGMGLPTTMALPFLFSDCLSSSLS